MQLLIQGVLQDIPEFRDASVTINDWSGSDLSGDLAPFAVVTNADFFVSRQTRFGKFASNCGFGTHPSSPMPWASFETCDKP